MSKGQAHSSPTQAWRGEDAPPPSEDAPRLNFKEERYILPDYIAPGLKLVFVGINPSPYSVENDDFFTG